MNNSKKMVLSAVLIGFLTLSFSGQSQELKSKNNHWIGQELWYKYSGGMEFHVKFEKKGLSYQALSKSRPDIWWGPFPFKSILTEKGEHLIAWYEKGYGDYVTLLIDMKNKTLYGSALIIVKGEPHKHMQTGSIYKTTDK